MEEAIYERLKERFIQVEWISECLKSKKLIDKETYLIKIEGNIRIKFY